MIRFTTDIIGAEILLFQEQAKLGSVKELLFSPDDGSVLGLLAYDPIQKKTRFIVATEIKRAVGGRVLVNGYDSLEDVEDLIRVKEAMVTNAKIVGETVITESGQKLGKVTAATVDMSAWRLSRLYVNSFLKIKFISRELLIPARKIVKIEKKQIIVSDSYAKVRTSRPVPVIKPVAE